MSEELFGKLRVAKLDIECRQACRTSQEVWPLFVGSFEQFYRPLLLFFDPKQMTT